MNVRNLGSAGLITSAIGLSMLKLSRRECGRMVQLALDMGITMLDTGDTGAQGAVEEMLGHALLGRRDDALVATQAGVRVDARGCATVDGTPAHLDAACDASLSRLNTDHIDLFYLSRVDPRVPVEDSVGKLSELVTAGKIRYLGMRGATAGQLRRAHATHPVSSLAVDYSLRSRSAEKALLPVAASLGVGVVACGPLGHGLLTGNGAARASASERAALRAIEAEASELDLGLARLVLAWLLSWRDDVVPVPSTRNPAHLEMNASAADIRLAPDICARLAALFPLE
jgi:aryl-alcohol dehydrogenase-like predicted oxidoreductase